MCDCTRWIRHQEIVGVSVHVVSLAEALDTVDVFLACPDTHIVNHIPADPIVLAMDDPAFRADLNGADLNLPDGVSVRLAARLLGVPDGDRITGSDFMLEVMKWGLDRGVRHALVGGTAETLSDLVRTVERNLPSVSVTAVYAPPIRDVTPAGVREDLRALGSDYDVLWVGLGTPKQQRWATLARVERTTRMIVTVGAAFDFISGAKRRAPKWISASGLEWAFRLASEPRRLWRRYLIGNRRFAWGVARQLMASRGER
jgi:N-acetylglucosaminyldiphosphoundecaprenol N-acetyl-beta-D-mannosaminyltransferase